MSSVLNTLFSPFELAGLPLDNRLVMAPMTRSLSPGGVPGSDVAAYYRRRVEGGLGLVITEGTTIGDPSASSDINVPEFYGQNPLAGWKKVVDEVHDAGGKIMPQLWHVGSMRRPGQGHHPDVQSASPSGMTSPGKKKFEPMTAGDIERAITAFADAAREAQDLGFDGIEIHGAHGYLIDQFFWAGTNERTDEYGGSLSQRTKFVTDIVRAIRAEVGSNYPIVLRYSQWKQQDFEARLAETPNELASFLEPLVDAGIDAFHCSTRRFWEPEFEGSDLNLAGWTKKLTGKTTITVGSVGLDDEFVSSLSGKNADTSGVSRIEELAKRLDREEFDLIAVGRAVLVDPQWANKIRDSRFDELEPYTPEALGFLS